MGGRRFSSAILGIVLSTLVGCQAMQIRISMKKGNELYTAQKYEEAIEEYQKILAIDSSNWGANYQIAISYTTLYHPGSTHQKDLEYADKAIGGFETCLRLKAPDPETMDKVRGFYLGLLSAADRNDKAIAYLETELEKNPTDTTLMNQVAALYTKTGEFDKALGYFEKRAAIDPRNKEAWYTIGVACWDRSYHGGILVSNEERERIVSKGLEALEKALSLDPDYFDALSYINLLYREQAKYLAATGKPQEAGEAILKAEAFRKKAEDLKKKAPSGTGSDPGRPK